ncbi:UDP-N-acetylmuramate dehydrogenase [uncultured Thiodictyon sp.]|uniref:UDP-N-acetylmuramate dehydrogenase n=1 Tax=uncultured Thiodictyon sp. TaxID=1846217 RepID=UPI0025FA2985|nr:UDP-N-acetylmuramate dehydrogenase [uncultured Thiodictyon sp.]
MHNSACPRIQEYVNLRPFNTLRFDVAARYFAVARSASEIVALLNEKTVLENDIFVLGGGSNVLFSTDFNGIVIKIEIPGKTVIFEDDDYVELAIGAGEDWPSVVEFVVSKGWGGIENLAMVPGTAGAAPVNNIACYGHNLHESLVWVESLDLNSGTITRLAVDECAFGYRTSIFKKELRGRHIVVRICLRLRKNPILNTSYTSRYESVYGEMASLGPPPYGVQDVFRAIVNIRKRKLPDVATVGTVGSVFMNPVITAQQLKDIRVKCPDIHYYPAEHLIYGDNSNRDDTATGRVKIPAAWLIEDMGLADKKIGQCGIWKTQPLNIVNYGGATPGEYLEFLKMVRDEVYERYAVTLDPEVVII